MKGLPPPARGLALLLLAGAVAARAETAWLLRDGEVEVAFRGDADALSPARDYTATITVTAPASLAVRVPGVDALRARFQGFAVAEGYEREPAALPGGRVETGTRWRLVADPAAGRYRLAPFAVDVSDASGASRGSFATAPLLFPLASLPPAEGPVELSAKAFFVPPSGRAVARWSLRALAGLALAALAAFALRRGRRAARLRRMTPSERAFAELSALLGRRLAEKGLFKDYYVELTHVVRRYIERAHRIRAPRLTTEEFLAAASGHPHFTPEALRHLSEFLHAADRVKFAGEASSPEVASGAAASARRYIERDSAPAPTPEPPAIP